jgi:hypothetical protein
MFIFLFITTFIGAYNLFSDLKKREIMMEFEHIAEILKDGGGLDLLKLVLFSPFSTIFIFILLIISLFGYFSGNPNGNLYYIIFLGVLLLITNIIQIGISIESLNLVYILFLPVVLILLSFLFILVGIYNINTNGENESIPYSQLDKNSAYYKLALILDISLLIIFLTYFVLFYTQKDKNMQYQLYSVTILLYCISCGVVFMASNVLQKKFLGKTT